ncbi:Retrovirus-related Pol polyprotein [Arachis hypogaea]|nr:Retrovirus-related Pol polyprotein [Arachis hypogaea]
MTESFLFAYEDMLEIFKSPSNGIAIANLSQSFLTGNGRGGGARRPRGGRFQGGGRSSFWNAPRPQCLICGIPGHVAWNCFYHFDQQFQPGSTSSGYSRQIPYSSSIPPPPSSSFHQPRALLTAPPSSLSDSLWLPD